MVSEDHKSFGIETSEKTIRVLLVDLENCPSQIQQLMKNLEQYSHVIVCYAQSGAKIPLDWIVPLTATVNDNRLKVVKMPNGGKNAADFGITFWAGVLMSQLPLQAHFTIVSNDSDLDHVVSLLISQQRSAERIGAKKESILLPPRVNESATTVQNRQIQEYCLHLVNHNKNRPAKKETLINNIKSKFKDNGIVPEELFNQLVKEFAIALPAEGNKITYNEQKIAKLAKV